MAPPRRGVPGGGARPGDPWGGRGKAGLKRQQLPLKQDFVGLLQQGSTKYRAVEKVVQPFLQEWRWNPDLATFALKTLSQKECPLLAFQVCQVMRRNKVTPQTVHFNHAINSCRNCKYWLLSLDLLLDMADDKVAPDESTVKEVMAVCAHRRRWRLVLGLFEYFRQHPGLELVSFRNALRALLESPSRWKQALGLWQELKQSDVVPDGACWSHAIRWHGLSGAWEDAIQLLVQGEQVALPNWRLKRLYSAGLFAMGRTRQWQVSLNIMGRLKAQDLDLSETGYRDIIMTCATSDQVPLALQLLKEMVEEGWDPDRSFTAMMQAVIEKQRLAQPRDKDELAD